MESVRLCVLLLKQAIRKLFLQKREGEGKTTINKSERIHRNHTIKSLYKKKPIISIVLCISIHILFYSLLG